MGIYLREIKVCARTQACTWILMVTYNSPKLETTQRSFDCKWIKKTTTVVHIYSGIHLENKKGINYRFMKKKDWITIHYAKWKKPDSIGWVIYYSIYIIFLEIQTKGTEKRLLVSKGCCRGRIMLKRFFERNLWNNKIVPYINCWWLHNSVHLTKVIEFYAKEQCILL